MATKKKQPAAAKGSVKKTDAGKPKEVKNADVKSDVKKDTPKPKTATEEKKKVIYSVDGAKRKVQEAMTYIGNLEKQNKENNKPTRRQKNALRLLRQVRDKTLK